MVEDCSPAHVQIKPGHFVIEKEGKMRDYYKIGKVLGSGAFGTVRLCTEKESGAQRAVKMLKKSSLNEAAKERLVCESEILKKMDHPNIMKLYEMFQDNVYFYFVTELCIGGELFEQITASKHFSEKKTAQHMQEFLSALVYCHSQNIVHRDIKPDNLIFANKEANSALKVIDFGTSQEFNPETKMTQRYGTPYYIAPEVLAREYGKECDVWSAGVILYVMLSGVPPFQGYNETNIMDNVTKGVYSLEGEIWDTISAEAKDLIRGMLTYDPKKRLTAEEALNHKWICETAPAGEEDPEITNKMLNRLTKFKANEKLQQASLMFIVNNFVSEEDKLEMTKVFKQMDVNGDGRLSKEELIQGYSKLHGEGFSSDLVEEEVEEFMKNVDIDQNGYIDYSEFALATMSYKTLLSEEKLKRAFKFFDTDNSGSIEASEIKAILGVGQKFNDEVWNEIVKESDENKDGTVSFEEFENMIKRFTVITDLHSS